MLAAIAKVPELELDQSEADALARAVANVARHYNLKASSKAVDWTGLIMCIGTVYGSRAVAIRASRMADAG